jgi:beta-glucosidase
MRFAVATATAVLVCAIATAVGHAQQNAQPWTNPRLNPDERARLAEAAMTDDERFALLHGPMALSFPGFPGAPLPKEAVPGAGYIPSAPRLGIPALKETDASLGVTNPGGARPGDTATAFPAGLALGSTFDLALAEQVGAAIGREARSKGFNVLLGGGINLARDPRNGRNFEYVSEDPLLSGLMGAAAVIGTQSQGVISTIKHYSLNDQETNRNTLDAQIDHAEHRESDLLAFQIAIEKGRPGAVMCSYNLVNGVYACGNDQILNGVLKTSWGFPGWVMSDWGAVHDWRFAVNGLDQQSGEQIDKQVWFDAPLKAAMASGEFSKARLSDMVRRILRSMFAVGVTDWKETPAVDAAAHAATALQVARQGVVLLKNDNSILPLSRTARIAVIGGKADVGVLSGAGSSQVTPPGGFAAIIPVGGEGAMSVFRREHYHPAAPLAELRKRAPSATIRFDAGQFPESAAILASRSDVAIIFVTRHEGEGFDVPNMTLPHGQDELIAAVADANPNTIVVLETGNPVAMPWLSKVKAVLAAWYPGQGGAQAISEILFGDVNPSGRLPITFPAPDAVMRPELPGLRSEPGENLIVKYEEGSDVGYRWYRKHGKHVLFPFGHGLSYTEFAYSDLAAKGGDNPTVTFTVRNIGQREGADVPQLYVTNAAGVSLHRLTGFERVTLKPGESKKIQVSIDPRLLAEFDASKNAWRLKGGRYRLALSTSANSPVLEAEVSLQGRVFGR